MAQDTAYVHLDGFRQQLGLSSGVVTCIAQDAKGFMWFGTINGLNRYDGYKFTTYRNDANDRHSIASDYITSLLRDKKGRLWAGTANGEIELYDPLDNKFIHAAKPPSEERGKLAPALIKTLAEDASGDLLAVQRNGLVCIRQDTKGLRMEWQHIEGADSIFQKAEMRSVYTDHQHHVFLFSGPHLYRLEQTRRDHYRVAAKHLFPGWDFYEAGALVDDTINKRIIIQTLDHLIAFPDYRLQQPDTLVEAHIPKNDWSLSPAGDIWYYDRSLRSISVNKKRTLILAADPKMEYFISHNPTMYWDRTGNLWLGTLGYGVGKYSPTGNQFGTFLAGKSIGGFMKLGTNDFALEPRRFSLKPNGTVQHNGTLPTGMIAPAGPTNFWRFTSEAVEKINSEGKVLAAWPFHPPEKIINWSATSFIARDGKVWRGLHFYPYLLCFDTTSKTTAFYKFPADNLADYEWIKEIKDDAKGRIWIATINGIYSFDTHAYEWIHHKLARIEGQRCTAFSMCDDPTQANDFLWVGTEKYGLLKVNKRTGAFISYNAPRYLPDNCIYSVLPDNADRLWLSSQKGLVEFDPQTLATRIFDRSDGLQDDEFNQKAALQLDNGMLLFGGLLGANYFNPAALSVPASPDVVLTGFKLFNKDVVPGDSSRLLTSSISYTNKLRLNHDQNVITLEFAGLDYSKTNGLYYRHRLAGFDKDWVYTERDNAVTYTNLNPGEYQLQIQCRYSGGKWSEQASLLTLTIIPPWYRRWWAILLFVLLIAGILFAIYRVRIIQQLKIEAMRRTVARDLHDDLGATLSAISLYAKVTMTQSDMQQHPSFPILKRISDNAIRAMTSLNDIIWSINVTNEDFASLVSRMRERAVELFENSGCNLSLAIDDQVTQTHFAVKHWRDFYLLYREALNNAAKYSSCGSIYIRFAREQDHLVLEVRDNGKGFDSTVSARGNGLKNMRSRADRMNATLEIVSTPGKGTTIRLTV